MITLRDLVRAIKKIDVSTDEIDISPELFDQLYDRAEDVLDTEDEDGD